MNFRRSTALISKGVVAISVTAVLAFSGVKASDACDDPKALAEFANLWSELMDVTIVPVLEDAHGEVLQRIAK